MHVEVRATPARDAYPQAGDGRFCEALLALPSRRGDGSWSAPQVDVSARILSVGKADQEPLIAR